MTMSDPVPFSPGSTLEPTPAKEAHVRAPDQSAALTGLQARLACKVALHNSCLWLNRQLGREPLAFAELLDW
jgi:hypothetical protein